MSGSARLRRFTLAGTAALLVAGCASGSSAGGAEPLPAEASGLPSSAELQAPVTLRLGRSVRVGGADPLRITFEVVEDDSRCPRTVVCVWAGDAAVRLRLDHAVGMAVATLHTTLDPKEAAHAGYVVRLLRLVPERPDDRTYVPYYDVTLEVRRE